MNYVKESYELAKKRYAGTTILSAAIIDDVIGIIVLTFVIGFENPDGELTGGIQTTGNYPGRATTPEQLMADIDKAINWNFIYVCILSSYTGKPPITGTIW